MCKQLKMLEGSIEREKLASRKKIAIVTMVYNILPLLKNYMNSLFFMSSSKGIFYSKLL